MNFSIINGAQVSGIIGEIIQIETDVSRGLSFFQIIGLADKTVDESRERILGALKNSKLSSPKNKNQRVIVSLLPSNKRKSGSTFDLPIALSYLLASGEIKNSVFSDKIFVGELSLGGEIKPVSGVSSIIISAINLGYKEIFIPKKNSSEASLFKNIKIFPCKNLNQVKDHLNNRAQIQALKHHEINLNKKNNNNVCDLTYFKINGQLKAKRGLEISVAGGHHLVFCGSPGTGKTFLAKNIIGILPNLKQKEMIECAVIRSVSEDNFWSNFNVKRSFRSPHHSSSYASMVGGGSGNIRPGEITLAHHGVLFMDEFPEYNKNIIEALRQPLEDKSISISRANQKITLPANFILVASLNPCGYYKSNRKKCSCTTNEINKYRKKISGPILDRIDLWINLDDVEYKNLICNETKIKKEGVRKFLKNIERVKNLNQKRIGKNKYNGDLTSEEVGFLLKNNQNISNKILEISKKLNLSARSYFKIIKVSRTIADLDGSEKIKEKHLMEALQYRSNF